jgi:hypothetical protein
VSERIVVRSIVILGLIVRLAREHCVAKQNGGVYTVESGWRLPPNATSPPSGHASRPRDIALNRSARGSSCVTPGIPRSPA